MNELNQAHSTEPARGGLSVWFPALLLAGWNIVSAPFLTVWLVKPLRQGIGVDSFVVVFAALSAAVGIAVAVIGFWRLREDRWRRSSLIAVGLVLVVLYAVLSDRGMLREEVVERMHFVTYGLLAALLVVPMRRLGALAPLGAVVAALFVGLVDEFLQWLVPVRVGEFFDVGLNVYAASCGGLAGLGLFTVGWPGGREGRLRIGWTPERAPWSSRRPGPEALHRLGLLAAVVVLAAAGLVQAAHLGHRVEDPEGVGFRSFFEHSELLERDRAARERWGRQAPGPLTPLEKEDWYRSEAGWHVLARNRAYREEDWWSAHNENRILERYYGAFLDTETPSGKTHRWDEEHTRIVGRLAEGAAPGPGRTYVSTADNGRIWLEPSPWTLWSGALLVAALLVVSPWVRRA